MERIPHTIPVAWPTRSDSRFAAHISTESSTDCHVCLLGLPDDLGVQLNNGRPGAAKGPEAFRAALATLGTPYDGLRGRPIATRVYDAGDIPPAKGNDTKALDETHERITQALLAVHEIGMIPICIGGGHDLTFPAVRALSQHEQYKLGGINLDAHLDVRAEPGSGMPFRKLIEDGHIDASRFTTLGTGRFANSQAHTDWLESQGGHIVAVETVLAHATGAIKDSFSRMTTGSAPDAPCFVTFDLDAIDASQAPGVSAPNAQGIRTEHAMELARRAGRDPRVKHIDIMELNPAYDIDNRTARLAALLFLTIVAGVEDRIQ